MISGIFSIAVCIVTAVLSYFLGLFQHSFMAKREKNAERFEKLYAPFEKMLWLHTHGAFHFSDLDPQLQREFFELLFNNYEYADSELKELLMRFKWAYDTPGSDTDDANKCFFLIEKRIDSIFNVLSKKLFLEPYSFKHSKNVSKMWDDLS